MTFRQWLKKNDNRLRGYSPDEIAELALACGFTLTEICPDVIEHLSFLRRLQYLWESPLLPQWLELRNYETGKDD